MARRGFELLLIWLYCRGGAVVLTAMTWCTIAAVQCDAMLFGLLNNMVILQGWWY